MNGSRNGFQFDMDPDPVTTFNSMYGIGSIYDFQFYMEPDLGSTFNSIYVNGSRYNYHFHMEPDPTSILFRERDPDTNLSSIRNRIQI